MIINRYLIRELRNPLVAILGILIALFASYTAAGFLSDAVNGLLPVGAIGELIGFKILISLEVLIPASLYISVLLSFARLHSDSEIAAMSAIRVKPTALIRAVLTLSGSLALVVAVLSLVVRPFAYHRLHKLSDETATLLNINAMEAGSFYVGKHGTRVIFLGHRPREGSSARDVFVKLLHRDRTEVIFAHVANELPKETLTSGADVYLTDAHIYELNRLDGQPDQVLQAQGLVVSPDGHKDGNIEYSAVAASSAHLFTSQSNEDNAELQWRLSTPVSTLLLGLLGIPLSRTKPRQNKYSRFGNALLVYFGYYLLCTSARTWVQHGVIGRFPGIWWAPVLLGLFFIAAMYFENFKFSFRHKAA